MDSFSFCESSKLVGIIVFQQHHRIAGSSLELSPPSQHGNIADGQGNDLGYGKSVRDLDNPQRSFLPQRGKNVQRLSDDGEREREREFKTLSLSLSLRYSPAHQKWCLEKK